MASLVLGAIGYGIGAYVGAGTAYAAVLGTVGEIVGVGVGAWIDQAYTYPAVFGNQNQKGPGLADLKISSASEGNPMNVTFGPGKRVAGTIIWMSPIRHFKKHFGGGKGGGSGSSSYTYFQSIAAAFSEGPEVRYREIWADGKIIYRNGGHFDSRYVSIAFYPGTMTQDPDPTIESYEGTGNVPAYRGTSYIVIRNLQLASWGNRPPNLNALIQQGSGIWTVRDAITAILTHQGLGTANFDVSLVSDDSFWGIGWSGPQGADVNLKPIMMAYDISCRDNAGVLQFFNRSLASTPIVVNADDLATQDGQNSGDTDRPLSDTDNPTRKLPLACTVTYEDPSNDYQQGSERWSRKTNISNAVMSINFGQLVLQPDQAMAIAQKTLFQTWAEKDTIAFSVPPNYINIQEGDPVSITAGTLVYDARVLEVLVGQNQIHQIKAIIEESQTLTPGPIGGWPTPGPVQNPIGPPAELHFYILNIAPLADTDVNIAGFYMAACFGPTDQWTSADVWISSDNITFHQMVTIAQDATMGKATSTLSGSGATAYTLTGTIDATNTFDVTISGVGVLSSATDTEIQNGANVACLGPEILAFQTATQTGAQTYTISNLYRGLRDTDPAISVHVADEPFVVVTDPGPTFVQVPNRYINTSIYYKVVPAYTFESLVTPKFGLFTGQTIVPFKPINLKGIIPNGTTDCVLFWTRRARWIENTFIEANTSLDTTPEKYSITIKDGTGGVVGTVLRVAQSPDQELIYSALQQTADGRGTINAEIWLEVFQVNPISDVSDLAGAFVTPAGASSSLAAPTSVGGIGVAGGNRISWIGVTGAKGYFVKRSATMGGPYVVTNVVYAIYGTDGEGFGEAFDVGVSQHIDNYYIVSAFDDTGEGTDSSEATVVHLY